MWISPAPQLLSGSNPAMEAYFMDRKNQGLEKTKIKTKYKLIKKSM
jgi:hypothetical protein